MKVFACKEYFDLVAIDSFLFFQWEHLLNVFLYGTWLTFCSQPHCEKWNWSSGVKGLGSSPRVSRDSASTGTQVSAEAHALPKTLPRTRSRRLSEGPLLMWLGKDMVGHEWRKPKLDLQNFLQAQGRPPIKWWSVHWVVWLKVQASPPPGSFGVHDDHQQPQNLISGLLAFLIQIFSNSLHPQNLPTSKISITTNRWITSESDNPRLFLTVTLWNIPIHRHDCYSGNFRRVSKWVEKS